MNQTQQQNLINDKVEHHIFRFPYDDEYQAIFEKESDGTKLRVKQFGATIEEAFDKAYAKWYKAIDSGVPDLTAPQLEHQPTDNEEVPF